MGIERYLAAMLRGKSAIEIMQSMSAEDLQQIGVMVRQNASMLPRRMRRKAERDVEKRTKKHR